MKYQWLAAFAALAMHALPGHAAVSLSRDGSGQGLLFPYATVEAGQSTLIAIDNPTDRAKAIKYHVRESREGHIAASGTAYVPAFGRWSVALVDPDGIGAVALQFGSSGCLGYATDDIPDYIRQHEFPDGEPSGVDFWPQATVSVDAVELGVLDADLTQAVAENCSRIWSRWKPLPPNRGEWSISPTDRLSAPSGGLRGTAMLLDVAEGTAFAYPALGFNGLSTQIRHDILHFQAPYLSDIQPESDGYLHVRLSDDRTLRFQPARGIDVISALLAASHATVGFSVNDSATSRTELVVAMPTRYAYVGGVVDQPWNEESLNNPPKLSPPFTHPACETASYVSRSGSGKLVTGGSIDLCAPATIVRVRTLSKVLRTPLLADERAEEIITAGSGTISLDFAPQGHSHVSLPNEEAHCWRGLPVWVMALTALDGTSAAAFPHVQVAPGSYEPAGCMP